MTYHIKLEYKCPKCSMEYIPFKKGITCPKCSFIDEDTKKYHNFIEEVLRSMTINKIQHGRYRPDAWYQGSISDAVQGVCFHFFDRVEHDRPNDPKAFLDEYTMNMGANDEYDRKFITEAITEAYKSYNETKKPRLIRGHTKIGRMISNLVK